MLALLRALPLLLPAPQLLEAALSLAWGLVNDAGAPVRRAAVHTLVWFTRHAPTARVRSLAGECLASSIISARALQEQLGAALVRVVGGSGGGSGSGSGSDWNRTNFNGSSDRRYDHIS